MFILHHHLQSEFLYLAFIISFFIINETTMARTLEAGKEKAVVMDSSKNNLSALLIFGDSLLDNGNNNYINNLLKTNFKPYGIHFPNHVPTGRYTNGLLLDADIIARYVGMKDFLPPYLDPSLSIEELMTGVTFASAGTGFTPTINNVIPMSKQLEYFKEYQKKLEETIGKKRTTDLIEKALYIVGAGTNDFILNYFSLPIRGPSTYTVSSYTNFLLKNVQQFIEVLMEQGARKIGVKGMPPIGCIPIAITAHSKNPLLERDCVDYMNTAASKYYNERLQLLLKQMQMKFADSQVKFVYLDIYGPLSDIITPSNNYSMCPHLLF